jgi:aspartate-semialdehyde dehydrogenase
MKQWRVGIIGATGMVGQRFVLLLHNHPWFKITCLAASARSAGQTYQSVLEGRWGMEEEIPASVADMTIYNAEDIEAIAPLVDFVFCAVSLEKSKTRELEEAYAQAGIPVVSNNSACRGLEDVPMIIPEINAEHFSAIEKQKERLGGKGGFIVVKPNCSIQSYVPALHPLRHFGIEKISVCTYQAISGAGKTFETWPEMVDNVIPYIGGEEEKSEQEPLKIWGHIHDGVIQNAQLPLISAQCLRVPVTDGHMAAVSVSFRNKPTKEQILESWQDVRTLPQELQLPSAASPYLKYFEEDNRPQSKLDRDLSNGMGISIGRLREDKIFDYRFVCLSHNTLRGAAGGAVETAELLCKLNYIKGGNDA